MSVIREPKPKTNGTSRELSKKEQKFSDDIDPELNSNEPPWAPHDPAEKNTKRNPGHRFNVVLNAHYLAKLRYIAAMEERSAQAQSAFLIRRGLEEYLDKMGPKLT
jgi:hypothetical protein